MGNHPFILATNYHFTFWTPARTTLTVSYQAMDHWGFFGTATKIDWSVFKNVEIYNTATQVGRNPVILSKVSIPYYLKDTPLMTQGLKNCSDIPHRKDFI